MSAEREYKPVVGTYIEHSDKREAEEASRERRCEGCGRQRLFNRLQFRLRTTVKIDGQYWHIQCYRKVHPGRSF